MNRKTQYLPFGIDDAKHQNSNQSDQKQEWQDRGNDPKKWWDQQKEIKKEMNEEGIIQEIAFIFFLHDGENFLVSWAVLPSILFPVQICKKEKHA
ncbi:hypothetical protein LPTSP4_20570 [Leptospira ryugenii]|uniref:Uncharacterized protein n=1 Tax=Leptospira ryugenii TaxID=1917863 RepID=A0A2P2E0W9_9LEPT|nr:hypothetical protein LPTSP4_20570 [Leptospira ryugenii]